MPLVAGFYPSENSARLNSESQHHLLEYGYVHLAYSALGSKLNRVFGPLKWDSRTSVDPYISLQRVMREIYPQVIAHHLRTSWSLAKISIILGFYFCTVFHRDEVLSMNYINLNIILVCCVCVYRYTHLVLMNIIYK